MADAVLIDMSDPSGSGAPDADADTDVVVVSAEAAEGETLPPQAKMQADGSVILTLRYPVTLRYKTEGSDAVREVSRSELQMYRLNGAAMRAVMSAGAGHAVTTGIAKSCRMAKPVFDKLFDLMDGADAAAAAQVFSFFLSGGAPTATGQPGSP